MNIKARHKEEKKEEKSYIQECWNFLFEYNPEIKVQSIHIS